MVRLLLDAGHYGHFYNAGAVPGYYESEMNWKLTNMVKEELEKYKGIEVGLTRDNINTDIDVYFRGAAAKGYDAAETIHSNAADSQAKHVVCISLADDKSTLIDDKSRDIAVRMSKAVGDCMGLPFQTYTRKADWDRDGNGIYDDEYYGFLQGGKKVGKTPAIITEHGFHTYAPTAQWLMDDENIRKLARAKAKCWADYFGLKLKASTIYGEPQNKNKNYRGTWIALKDCAIRTESRVYPGTKIGTIKKGAIVHCYEWYSKPKRSIWLWVTAVIGGKTITGFICKKNLKLVK